MGHFKVKSLLEVLIFISSSSTQEKVRENARSLVCFNYVWWLFLQCYKTKALNLGCYFDLFNMLDETLFEKANPFNHGEFTEDSNIFFIYFYFISE